MRAGDLRHRVTLQQRASARDALGGHSTAWSDVATVWAQLVPLSGRELMAAQAVNTEVTHTVSIRWQQQFADPRRMAALRIAYGTRYFNIHASIDVEERHRVIELTCSEGLNDG